MSELLWFVMLAQAYCVVYGIAAYSHLTLQGGALAPWKPWLVAKEALGWLLRRTRKLPVASRFTANNTFFASLRLSASNATEGQLMEKVRQVSDYMSAHRWAYPESQRQNLRDLTIRAVQFIRSRDALRGAQARTRQAASALRSWRAVMGLASHEQDPDTVRKAYRKLRRGSHPDQGGCSDRMAELSRAMAEARKELNFV